MPRQKLSKAEKQTISDAINQALNMDVDWTKLSDVDLIKVYKRFADRVEAVGGIAGAIINDYAKAILSQLQNRANRRLAEIVKILEETQK
jgi:hypothetical protein